MGGVALMAVMELDDPALRAPSPSAAPAQRTQGFEVIRWMEACLVHTEGEWRGRPFRLMDWQKRLLLELFRLEPDPEWIPVPGEPLLFRRGLRRRYRQAFICVPKKCGKTELAAAIALYLLIGDAEPSPKGVFVAGSLKQAGISFRYAQTMILESPILRQVAGERNVGDLVIEIPSIPGSRLERVAAEAGTNDGPSLHFGVLDEVHEYEGQQGVKVYGVVTNAGAARRNSLFVGISTVGSDLEDDTQVWVQLYNRGIAARADPASDPTFFFHIEQAPAGLDWRSREAWTAANPSHDVTVTWQFYESEMPKGEAWCSRYYLNRPPGRREDAWMPAETWTACSGDVVIRATDPAYVRIDIDHDHRAAAIAIAQKQGELVALRVRSFPLDPLPDGEYLDVDELEDQLRGLARRYRARVVTAKRYNAAAKEHLVPAPGPEIAYHGSFFAGSAQRLIAEGLALIDIPNSQERIGPAAETLKDMVVNRRLVHDGDPELAHQVGNVVAKAIPKGWSLQPATGTRRRIVAARAAMIAVHRAMNAPRQPSRAMHHGAPR